MTGPKPSAEASLNWTALRRDPLAIRHSWRGIRTANENSAKPFIEWILELAKAADLVGIVIVDPAY